MEPSITSGEVTRGQKDSLITLVVDATRKAMGVVIDDLVGKSVLNRQKIERVRKQGNKIVKVVTRTVKETVAELVENIASCLRLISGAETLTLEPTDGTRTIATANDVFAFIDPDFEGYRTNVAGSARGEAQVAVYEMIKDGNFAKLFGGLGDDLDQFCFEQDQIIQFVKKYRQWLRTEGYATFFLFKVDRKYFVADVFLGSVGRLGAGVHHFSRVNVWHAEDRLRVVVPQLALKS